MIKSQREFDDLGHPIEQSSRSALGKSSRTHQPIFGTGGSFWMQVRAVMANHLDQLQVLLEDDYQDGLVSVW